MAKFNRTLATQGAARTATGPIVAGQLDQRTGNGAPAFSRNAKSDLFLLAVTNFVSEDTFYEGAGARDDRFERLVHEVTAEDPAWMQAFIPWLRNEANMRSASLVAAAEYVKAGGPLGRQVVVSAISRADEPAEIVAYWIARHGEAMPMAFKRGVADAARKFYNERNVLKYNSSDSKIRMSNVLSLTHPRPRDDSQSRLFKFILADRYDSGAEQAAEILPTLPMLAKNREFRSMSQAEARARLLANPDELGAAGFTWESFSSLGAMDAAAWEAMIPRMGYMALLRNLRNFDQAGVSEEVADYVIAKLQDPDEVARSRQLPFRFVAAYKNAPSLRWGRALERAVDYSTQNVPEFTGKSLVLVDTSGSMQGVVGGKNSTMSRVEAAALFGAVVAKRNKGRARLVQFASYAREVDVRAGESALQIQKRIMSLVGTVGHGTDIRGAVNAWSGEDRIFIFSDMQTTTSFTRAGSRLSNVGVPAHVPVYGFNLAGYSATPLASGNLQANEHEMGGLTDKTFSMISMIEQGKTARWPWE
jgi:hypothetical protein